MDIYHNDSMLVEFAYAYNRLANFSCHQTTWAEFVDQLRAESDIQRTLDLTKNLFPVFIPGKLSATRYEARYEGAHRVFERDMKKSPPEHGDWWPEWVDRDVISQISLLMFDLDGGMSLEQVKAALDGYESVLWSTKRSTAEHPRWRVGLLLERSFAVAFHENAARLWKRAYLAAAKQLGLDIDTSCDDLCRRCTLPVGNRKQPVTFEHLQGKPFDIHHIIDHLPDEPVRPKKKTQGAKGLPPYWNDVLAAILNTERTVRLQVGMGLHHATEGSDEGMDIWFSWAQGAWTHDDEHQREWDRFDSEREGGITWGTVEFLAWANGWQKPKQEVIAWPETDPKGNPVTKSIPNVEAALQHLGVVLFYNEFADRHRVDGRGALEDKHLRELWSDAHLLNLKVEFDFFCRVVITIAERDCRHPVRAYLDKVQSTWDGKPRLDRLLVDYAGAKDTEFNSMAPAKWMIAGVRRVRQPGCKFDNMLLLESKEGVGKSTFGNILASEELFSDCLPIDADPKVVIEQTRGFWIIEFAELKDIKSKDVETVKGFLSRRVDSARGAYGKMRSDVPRQWVSFGSTNDTTYLVGTTGNRRFWPVAVDTIDIEGVRRDREQLWAEAAVREARGESIELPEELWPEAAKIQESRRVKDPIEERLEELLIGLEGIVRREDIYAAVDLGVGNISRRTARHGPIIKSTMERRGWKHDRKRLRGDKNKSTVFQRGESEHVYKWDAAERQFLLESWSPPKKSAMDEFAGEPVKLVDVQPQIAANLN